MVPCAGVDHMDFTPDGRYLIASCEFSGQLVKVFYDQKLLGARHADRILVLNRAQMPVKQQKG